MHIRDHTATAQAPRERPIEVETGKVKYATSLKARDLNMAPARPLSWRSRPVRSDAGSDPPLTGSTAASTLTPLRTLEGHIPQVVPPGDNGGVIGLAFNPDATLLVSGGDDQTVRLWSVQDGQLLRTMESDDRNRFIFFDQNIFVAHAIESYTLRQPAVQGCFCFDDSAIG